MEKLQKNKQIFAFYKNIWHNNSVRGSNDIYIFNQDNMGKIKTKNPIKRIGGNCYKIGNSLYSEKEYKNILKETQEEIKDFNFNFLVNWEEKPAL